jgi:tetratricopeptide (TPR) repeat protein
MYQQYLNDENSAKFIQAISGSYNMGSLHRLARYGDFTSRRAAVLAIGFVGNYGSNEVMGAALLDKDRAVRLLADHGIRQLWQRQGTPAHQQALGHLYRLVSQNRLDEAVDESTLLIAFNAELGEAWNQRAIALCAMGEYESAIEDCRQSLNCNRFHFPAAMGMGHCLLQLDDAYSALECFRLALAINPDLEGVRNHISHLERTLEG